MNMFEEKFWSGNGRRTLARDALAYTFVLLILVGMASKPAFCTIADNDVPRPTSAERVTLAGVTYLIPRNYLRFPISERDHGFLVETSFPGLKAIDQSSPEARSPGRRDVVRIKVEEAKTTTDAAFRWQVRNDMYGPLQSRGTKFGLTSYLGSRGRITTPYDPTAPLDKTVEELFTEKAPVTFFIDCMGDKAVRVPSCTEVFNAGGLLFEVNLAKSRLSDWDSIRAHSINLIRSFSLSGDQRTHAAAGSSQ